MRGYLFQESPKVRSRPEAGMLDKFLLHRLLKEEYPGAPMREWPIAPQGRKRQGAGDPLNEMRHWVAPRPVQKRREIRSQSPQGAGLPLGELPSPKGEVEGGTP